MVDDSLSWQANTDYIVRQAYKRMTILQVLSTFGRFDSYLVHTIRSEKFSHDITELAKIPFMQLLLSAQ